MKSLHPHRLLSSWINSLSYRCFVAADYDARSLFRFSVDGRLIEVIDSDTELPLGCVDTDTRGRVYASMHYGLVVYSRGVK